MQFRYGDAAELCLRRDDVVVGVDGHDVVEFEDQPVRPSIAFAAVMDWRLLAQPGEIQADRVLLKKTRPRDIDFVDRDGCDFSCNIQLHRIGAHASSSIPDKQPRIAFRSEEHTSELQSLMRLSYAVFCLKKKKTTRRHHTQN